MSDSIDSLGGLGFLNSQTQPKNSGSTNTDAFPFTHHTVENSLSQSAPISSLPLPIANKLRNLIQVSTASTAPYAEFVHPTYLRVFHDVIVTGVNHPLPKLPKSQSKEEENNNSVDTSRVQEPPTKKAKQNNSKPGRRARTSNAHMPGISQHRASDYEQSNVEKEIESTLFDAKHNTATNSLEQEENSLQNLPYLASDDTNNISSAFFHARLEFVVKELLENTLRSRHAKTRLLGLQL